MCKERKRYCRDRKKWKKRERERVREKERESKRERERERESKRKKESIKLDKMQNCKEFFDNKQIKVDRTFWRTYLLFL